MTTGPLKALLTDFGDTLVRLNCQFLCEAAERISSAQGSHVTGWQVQQAWTDEWEKRRNPAVSNAGNGVCDPVTERRFWYEFTFDILNQFEVTIPTARLVAWLADRWGAPESYEPLPGVIETLEDLYYAGIKIVLVSNSFPGTRKIIRHTKLNHLCHGMVLSNHLGLSKPDPVIFMEGLKMAKVDKGQALFVDDHEPYVKAASELQIPAAWINQDQVCWLPSFEVHKGYPVITNFRQVISFFQPLERASLSFEEGYQSNLEMAIIMGGQ